MCLNHNPRHGGCKQTHNFVDTVNMPPTTAVACCVSFLTIQELRECREVPKRRPACHTVFRSHRIMLCCTRPFLAPVFYLLASCMLTPFFSTSSFLATHYSELVSVHFAVSKRVKGNEAARPGVASTAHDLRLWFSRHVCRCIYAINTNLSLASAAQLCLS